MDGHSQNNGNSGGANGANAGDQNNGGGTGGDNNQNQNQNQGGQQQQTGQLDLKTLSGDQLAQVLENPNLWQQPRIQELVKNNQEFKTLQDKIRKDEEKRLEEQNEHKTLAEQRKADLDKANETIQKMQIDQALTNKLVPEGVVDLGAAIALIDRGKIKIDDNGNITGVDEAIKDLKEGKTYLFGKGSEGGQSLGSASNGQQGNGGGQQMKFKRSQLRDPKFYQEHRDEILAASKAGLIEDDLSA